MSNVADGNGGGSSSGVGVAGGPVVSTIGGEGTHGDDDGTDVGDDDNSGSDEASGGDDDANSADDDVARRGDESSLMLLGHMCT